MGPDGGRVLDRPVVVQETEQERLRLLAASQSDLDISRTFGSHHFETQPDVGGAGAVGERNSVGCRCRNQLENDMAGLSRRQRLRTKARGRLERVRIVDEDLGDREPARRVEVRDRESDEPGEKIAVVKVREEMGRVDRERRFRSQTEAALECGVALGAEFHEDRVNTGRQRRRRERVLLAVVDVGVDEIVVDVDADDAADTADENWLCRVGV